jgi:hypothetical protein
MNIHRPRYKKGAQVRHQDADSALNIQACRAGSALVVALAMLVVASARTVVRRFDRRFDRSYP